MLKKVLHLGIAAAFLVSLQGTALANPSNAFTLKNSSGQTLHFLMRCTSPDKSKNQEMSIKAGALDDFWVDGCDEYEVTKSTSYNDDSDKTFRYTLEPGKTYELGWDKEKDAWDFKECDNEDCS